MSGFYDLIAPLIRHVDPETAHGLSLKALRCGLVPSRRPFHDPILASRLWGMDFPHPVGLAAGFDKDAEVPDAMLGQGFSFVEVGSITPRPQPGNPKPRLFRLRGDCAVINRMGFNNKGADAARERLAERAGRGGIVGVNLGKNKETEEAVSDYILGINTLAAHASYVVINVSSPNTPGLRALQGHAPLEHLLRGVRTALNTAVPDGTPPLLLKIAPDLTDEDREDIAAVVLAEGIDGLIATNTTIERPENLTDPQAKETGGLSGKPLFEPSTRVLFDMYRLTGGKIPLIGVGGVDSARAAYAKIRAGASLVQLYSAMVYEGPGIVGDILPDLAGLLRADGFSSLSDAVGADHN